MELTEGMLRQLAPRARSDYIAALTNGSESFGLWGFTSPERLSALLATACHETGGLTIQRENMHYSAERIRQVWPTRPEAVKFAGKPRELANSVYGGRMGNRLGTDDGWLYRGGGLPQLTGRDSFARAGKAIGVDLEQRPELIEDATVSLKALCWELSKFLSFCDRGVAGWRGVCNGINRGNALSKLDPIGWADRQGWYTRWSRALGVVGAGDDMLDYGDQGALVIALQERLAALGFASGRADGVFGSRTRAAVLAFQAENGLTTDGKIGPETRAALNADDARGMPLGERASETADDLAAAGSETISTARVLKGGAAVLMGAGGLTGGAQQSGVTSPPVPAPDLIAMTKDTVTEISSWRAITSLVGDTFAWATSHWWILAIVLGFCFYRWGGRIEWLRVRDHQTGKNLAR